MSQPSIEEVPCGCGAGVIRVDVSLLRIGVLAFRVEKPSPCVACGSVEIPTVEKERLRTLYGRDEKRGE